MGKTESAEALVKTVTPDGEERIDTELLKSVPWDLPTTPLALANVHVSRGLTIGLPNYSSARIDVSVTVPCHVGELGSVYEWCQSWCNDRVRAEAKNVAP